MTRRAWSPFATPLAVRAGATSAADGQDAAVDMLRAWLADGTVTCEDLEAAHAFARGAVLRGQAFCDVGNIAGADIDPAEAARVLAAALQGDARRPDGAAPRRPERVTPV